MRQFGIIASSIWRSKRFRQLESDLARLTYLYLHTTTHGNSAGLFVLPPELAALELRRDPQDVKAAIAELRDARLIRYDPEEELVQIVKFFQFNTPASRKQLQGPVKIVRDATPASHVRDACACDLVAAIYGRALTWEKSIEARPAFLQEAANIVRDLHLHELICSPEIGLSIDLLNDLSNDLCIALPIQQIPDTDKQTHTQTDTHTDKQTHKQTDTDRRARDFEQELGRLPSPPANCGRSGGREVPKDIQNEIEALKRASDAPKRRSR